MARTKQTMESSEEILSFATKMPNAIKEKILSMEFVQSYKQMCDYLTMKWQLARALQNSIEYLEGMFDINRTTPNFMSQEDAQEVTAGLEAKKKELPTLLGEIALIFCPVKDCPTHTNQTKNDSDMAKSNRKINEANNPKQNSKEKILKDQITIMPKTTQKVTKEQDRRSSKLQLKLREK
ncbi:uncharacterized protein TNCV_4551431 [Trichonephila clavipes]|nr:uncharacterized protein TNCV_4551431 [Trichonephila clavipes]